MRWTDGMAMGLRGFAQVMFQDKVLTGICFLMGFVGATFDGVAFSVVVGAVLGTGVATLTGEALLLPRDEGMQGLWGFNGALVGCAFPLFLEHTFAMWVALVLCAAMTVWVRTALDRFLAPMGVSSLTFPFVMCTWLFLLAAPELSALSVPSVGSDAVVWTGGVVGFYFNGVLRGVSQVFLLDSWQAGVWFLIGLAVSDWRTALWALCGSGLAFVVALLSQASSVQAISGLWGYSAVLTAIALGTVYRQKERGKYVWPLLGVVCTVVIQAALNKLTALYHLPSLTAPFCVAVWLFVMPGYHFKNLKKE